MLRRLGKRRTGEDFYFKNDAIHASTQIFTVLRNSGLIVMITAAATLISSLFKALGFHESNFIVTYNLGVLLIAYLTDGYVYCIIASVIGVLTFNYYFTEPYYTLMAYSPEYPVTFIIMLIAALIAGTLTARARQESQRAESRETHVKILYQLEKNLLGVNSKLQLLKVAAKDIGSLFHAAVLVCATDLNGDMSMRYVEGEDVFQSEKEKAACQETFQSGLASGSGKELFSGCSAYYLPIVGPSGILGVIGVALPDKYPLTESQKLFLEAISAQIALALERERLYEKQQKTKMEIERERLRGDLLRSVSHDLRTPLTSILGSASTMVENYDALSDEVRKEFISGIYGEAEWLHELVENVLSLTRLDGGKIKVKKELEAVEEIVAEAVARVKKRAGKHEIVISIPSELLMIPMDGILMEQVLVNLLDNAMKHTAPETKIFIYVKIQVDELEIIVSDNGRGISESDLPYIFNRYYSSQREKEGRRSMGLGLSICKSIIEAHGGRITAENAKEGGAVFRITLPAKESIV